MQRSNLQTIFQIQSIPTDTQMRDLIDPLPTGPINQFYDDFLSHLQRGKQLDPYHKQPFVKELKRTRMSFILVAKPTDHKILFEWVNELYPLDAGEVCHFRFEAI